MRKLFAILWIGAALSFTVGSLLLVSPGCTTTQQTTGYNTVFSIEQTTTAAVDSYYALVIQGKAATNGVPRVAAAYKQFQAGVVLALDGVQFNTNALAPANLLIESADLIRLVNTLTGK